MAFLYPFINFWQPGILWPWLADFKPMLLLSIISVATALSNKETSAAQQVSFLKHPTFVLLCVYVVVQILSVYYSGFGSMLSEFNTWYIYPLMVAISFLLCRDEKRLTQYVWGMLAGGALVVLWGINHHFMRPATDAGKPSGAYGLYENHNDFTFIALTLLPYAWLLVRNTPKFLPRAFLVATCIGCATAIMISLSRGGILVLALEVIMIAWLSMRGGKRVMVLGVLLAAAPVAVIHQFNAREEGTTNDYTAETAKTSRYELWTAAGRMVVKHPLLGVGSRRFKEFSSDYNEISHDNKGKVAHNTFLEIAAGSGLLGIGSFVAMLWYSLAPLYRTLKSNVQSVSPLTSIRMATFVASICIIVRANLDVKIFDTCIFTLLILAVASSRLTSEAQATDGSAPPEAKPERSRYRSSSKVYPSARERSA
jgi:O-antigen ligase